MNDRQYPISTSAALDSAPKGWRWALLSDVARLESGHTPSRREPSYWEGGTIPWLSLKDMRGLSGRIVSVTEDMPTQHGIDNSSARVLPKGTVAFCRTAAVGKVTILGRDMATSQDFANWVCGSEIVPEYLFEALRASGGQFEKEKQGSTHKTIYMPVLEKFRVLLPPPSEQRRIADILDQADALRAKRRAALAQLDTLTQAIFLEMFGDPAMNPKGWPVRDLASLSRRDDSISYGVVQPGDDVESGIPIVRVGDLAEGKVDTRSLKCISPAIEQNYKRSRLHGDEVLISCVGSVGVVALADSSLRGFNIARAVARVRLSEHADRTFVASCLGTPCVQRYFTRELRTVSQPTLNIKQLAETPVPLPPLDLQREFARRAGQVEHVRARQHASLAQLDMLFASLQHRAFRGEL